MDGSRTIPLIGRSAELAATTSAFERVASGSGQILVIEGEAGIGKTRLVEEIVESGGLRGFEVLVGSADEVERRRPFGAVAETLGISRSAGDPRRAEIGRLLAGDGTAGSLHHTTDVEFRISEAVLDLVEQQCARGPTVLAVENLHWADPSTLSCLARLGKVCAQLPLLLVVTARPLPRDSDLARLLEDLVTRGAVRAPLGPLAVDELPVLAEAVVGSPPGPNLRGQLARAGGNPLFVLELLAALIQDAAIVRTGVEVEIEEPAQSAVPSLTILHRLSFLTREALEVLSMASVLGSTFSVSDLSLLSGRSAATLAAPLREALAAGALAEQAQRLAFRHELIRDALYRDLPRALRDGMHRDLAWALAAAGHAPVRVAEHLLRGAQAEDPEAVEWLHKAATTVGARSPTVAVELLDHALDLAEPSSALRGRLSADRALALMWSGRPADGEAACREVLERRDDPEREGTLRWLLLRSMLIRGRASEALEHIDRAMQVSTASVPERAHYQASSSFARLVLGQLDTALAHAETAIGTAEPTGDALAVSESLHAKAQVLSVQGRIAEAASLAMRAVRALDGETELRGPQTAMVTAGSMLIAADRAAEGRQVLLRGRQLNERLGARSGLALHHAAAANGHFLTGDWDDAASEVEASVELTGDGRPAWPVMTLGILALIAVHRGDLDAAQSHLVDAGAALAAGAGPMRAHRMLLADALLAEAAGRGGDALATLRAGWDRLAAAGTGSAYPEVGPELVRRLVPAGKLAEAKEVAAAVEECAAHNAGVPNILGAARVCRGLADGDIDILLDGVTAYRTGAQPLGQALACEDAAAALVRAGRGDEARPLLDEAFELHERVGAPRGSARTLAALRAMGTRRGIRAPRTRARKGWEALTATERKVVALVAKRLSNPEIAERMFLSRRTVETHVSHALRKLGMRSRLELATEAARRGDLG